MTYRYLGPSRAGAGGVVSPGDLVESSHPVFAGDPKLWRALIEQGALVEVGEPECAMVAPAENAMAGRPRARKGGRP